MNSESGSSLGKPQFGWLKIIGALTVLWLTAKIIGAILSPGMLILGLVLWLVVRSQRNRAHKAAKPVVHFVPTSMTFPFPNSQPMQPTAPAGYWMPVAAPAPTTVVHSFHPQPGHLATSGQPSQVLDVRTQAEREIEDYVQKSWPNV